jgi:biopolymer transport protein ExbB/TolQ/DNA-directed RNA polymerase subunit RPC12/RpoP
MYFTFDCPECQKQLKVPTDAAGRKARCPYCKHSLVVPESPEPEESPSDQGPAFPGITDISTKSAAERAGRSASTKKPREASQKATSGGSSERTDVNLLTSSGIGLGVAVAVLLLMIPLKMAGIFIGELFLDRGWVPFALVFLFGWSVVILYLKGKKIKRQKDSMLLDLLPSELSKDITQESVGKFVEHVHELPVGAGESFLVNRVQRGLEHFRVRNSNPEVAAVLTSQSDIDANAVQSSYTILNVFIWAIPILGFIGTVIGISAAVSGIDMSGDVAEVKDSLNVVTSGLATAFDTTLIALVMSMFVMFPTSSLQKAEEDMLNSVDEYCNENLLKRLNDGREQAEEGGVAGAPSDVRQAVQAALVPWNEKLDAIGSKLTAQVVQGWGAINKEMLKQQQENAEQVRDIDALTVTLQKMLIQLAQKTEAVHQKAAGSMNQSAESIQNYCTTVRQGLDGLNRVLKDLGEKQVTIQAPPRSGWFSRRK